MWQTTENHRIEERTSLFIMATLHCTRGHRPVKLRNVSRTGAFIEGENIPAKGEAVEMRRGALSASGRIVWREGLRAGLHFDHPTDVEQWLPTAAPQSSVDKAVMRLREAAPPLRPNNATLHSSFISTEDMESVAGLLDDLADTLSNDAGVLFNYGLKLQALDIAAQMLRKLAFQSRG